MLTSPQRLFQEPGAGMRRGFCMPASCARNVHRQPHFSSIVATGNNPQFLALLYKYSFIEEE